jgi:hypothetical protein
MVLEARQGSRRRARLELASEEHVADHAALACNGLVGKQPCAGHERAVAATVAPAEQLVAATDGEERSTAADGGSDCGSLRREVRRDQGLLAVLTAADVEQVERIRIDVVAHAQRADV